MKILFLIRDLEAGGAERQLVVLANGLARKGHKISIGVFCSGGKFEEAIDRSRVELIDLEKPGSIPRPSFMLRLARLIHSLSPDVVHTYARSANFWGALAMPVGSGKLVWGFRNTRFNLSELYSRLADYASVLLRARVDLMISNSTSARMGLIEAGYPADKILAIPNGIDLGEFRRDAAARRNLRQAWGVEDDSTLVGLVGTARPEKDPDDFFVAARLAGKSAPRLRLACVGYLNDKRAAELKAVAAEAGIDPTAVAWAPSRGRLHEVYSALDVLCLSSRSGEGFPNVVGEAMACEVPCVVTDVGDAATIVGDLGWVVPAQRPDLLGDAIVEASRFDPNRAPQLRARIARNFSVERLVDRTEQALLAMLAQQAPANPRSRRSPTAAETIR